MLENGLSEGISQIAFAISAIEELGELSAVQKYLRSGITLLTLRLTTVPNQDEWLRKIVEQNRNEFPTNPQTVEDLKRDLGNKLPKSEALRTVFNVSYGGQLSSMKREKIPVKSQESMSLLLSIFSLCLYRPSVSREDAVELRRQFRMIQSLVSQQQTILETKSSLDES